MVQWILLEGSGCIQRATDMQFSTKFYREKLNNATFCSLIAGLSSLVPMWSRKTVPTVYINCIYTVYYIHILYNVYKLYINTGLDYTPECGQPFQVRTVHQESWRFLFPFIIVFTGLIFKARVRVRPIQNTLCFLSLHFRIPSTLVFVHFQAGSRLKWSVHENRKKNAWAE